MTLRERAIAYAGGQENIVDFDNDYHCCNCEGYDDYERECLGGLHLCNGKIELTTPIDPFSEVCKDGLKFAGFDDIDKSLKEEVASVVSPIENSYFTSRCPNEHIFKIEEALEYFGKL